MKFEQRYNDAGFRLAFALWMLYIPAMAVFRPFSMPSMAIYFDGVGSYPLLGVSAVVGAFIIIDVLFNEPCNRHEVCRYWNVFRWMPSHRTVIYGSGAFCALSIPYVVLRYTNQNEPGTFFYLLIFAQGVWLMVVDAIAKKRGACATIS